MTEKSNAAVLHLLRQAQRNPKLAYYIGPWTESYRLLTEAAAELEGSSVDAFRHRYEETLQTERPQPGGERC